MAGFAGEYWNKGKRELSEHRSQEGTEFIMNFLNGLSAKKEDDK
jgi:hypothetical protein